MFCTCGRRRYPAHQLAGFTKKIGKDAFKQSGLRTVSLPAGVSIGENAFGNCSKLQSITIQESNDVAGKGASIDLTEFGAFQYCTALQSIQLPANVTELGPNTFAYCSSLRSVQAPGVQKIGSGAFKECRKLSQIRFLPA